MRALIVAEKFGAYAKGARIDDPEKIAAILDSPDRAHVLAINVPDPKPAAADDEQAQTGAKRSKPTQK
jgi:hypothetical protein